MKYWYDVYPILADALADFYSRHGERAGSELFKICQKNAGFKELNPWFIKLEQSFKMKSIDPIQIFTSFNEGRQKTSERIDRIDNYFELLGQKRKPGNINFEGCPAPFAIRLRSVRNLKSQNEIWSFFHAIMQQQQAGLHKNAFTSLKSWYGIEVTSFTLFLFWIQPRYFLPLDKNTTQILRMAKVLDMSVKTYEQYYPLLREQNTDSYINLVRAAYRPEEEQAAVMLASNFYKTHQKGTTGDSDFRLVAIKPLGKETDLYMKVLHRELYLFCAHYEFLTEDKIRYDKSKELKMYDAGDVRINVSAIAGRNGSGKSTLTELLYMAINNLACRKNFYTGLELRKELHMDLFFHSDTFRKISFRGRSITVDEYVYQDGCFIKDKNHTITSFDLSQFFYTIGINYSLYGLNSRHLGGWIDRLFHKNDDYQVPLVLSPMRKEGNIDVNTEHDLTKSRLLALILEPDLDKGLESLRVLTQSGKRVETIVLWERGKKKFPTLQPKQRRNRQKVLEAFKAYFKIPTRKRRPRHAAETEEYIYYKLVKICRTYPRYTEFLELSGEGIQIKKLKTFYDKLKMDDSHVTFKLNQAKNHLKYDHYAGLQLNTPLEVDAICERIETLKEEAAGEESLRTVDLLPPPILHVEMFFKNGSSFRDLSSGEKQQIYTISSVLYHLYNLDSVSDGDELINYPFINLVFDEIELYFHPEMQRCFLKTLLDAIKKRGFDSIVGIGLCFITHSPFILSDLPQENVLLLSEEGMPEKRNPIKQTFGANIHDLLAESFFMKNYMGEFALSRVRSAIEYLDGIIQRIKKENVDSWTLDSVEQFINLIGEPLIKQGLLELYSEASLKTANI